MIFSCKCLNIIIEGKNESEVEEFDSSRFGLSPEENPKIFFKEVILDASEIPTVKIDECANRLFFFRAVNK